MLLALVMLAAACGGSDSAGLAAVEAAEQSQPTSAPEPTATSAPSAVPVDDPEADTEEAFAEALEVAESEAEPAMDAETNEAATEDASAAPTSSVTTTSITGTTTGTITESPFIGDYQLMDDEHGAAVTVTIADGERVMVANGLPIHDTGEFPNSGNPNTISEQDITATFPLEPTYVGAAATAREPGVTVAGVKFEPQTAERATCADGTEYSIEAMQDVVDLGLDFNNAHVQPTGAYHYHGTSQALVDALDSDSDIVHVGFAYDGFLIYYSRSGAYSPSYQLKTEDRTGLDCTYTIPPDGGEVVFDGPTPDGSFVSDWEYVASAGELDECNGIEINGEYAYFITDAYPFIGRCLNGEYTATGPGGGGGGAPGAGGGDTDEAAAGGQGGQPDLSDAADELGITVDELEAALGEPPFDLDAAAEVLGVSAADLEAALPPPPGR